MWTKNVLDSHEEKSNRALEIKESILENDIKKQTGSLPCCYEQHSRRYIGNKYKLCGFIRNIVEENCIDCRSVADVFAGTGVVGGFFNTPDVCIITNDFLVSNYVCLYSFLGVETNIRDRIYEMVAHLNNVPGNDSNYFSHHFGGRYFTQENARKIGAIRDEIDRIVANEIEKKILLCSLVYAADRVANTVGHYDAFRKRMDTLNLVKLGVPYIEVEKNHNNEVYCEDANKLIQRIECDLLYIDPPYNSRQYSDAYHLLENLTVWEKPPVMGIGRKMDRSHIKSRYCINGAADALSSLIEQASCRYILMSYNNTGASMDGRSNARIKDEEILEILRAKGVVEVYSQPYRAYTTGKNHSSENIERVFFCKVKG